MQGKKLDFAGLSEWVEADDWSSSRSSDVDSLSDDGTWIDLRGEDSDCESIQSCFSEKQDMDADFEAVEVFYTPVSSPLPLPPKLQVSHAQPRWAGGGCS